VTSLKQKSFKAFFWDLIGKLSSQGIGFFISILLARLLAPEEFGLLAMANVVIGLAGVLVDMGLGSALIQRQDVKEEHFGSVFYFNISIGTLLFLFFFGGSGMVADFYARPELKPIVQVMSLNFIINSFCNVQRTWLRKELNYSVLTKAGLWSLIIGGSIGIYLAYLDYGVWALVFQSLISGIVNNIYIYFFSGWKPRLIFKYSALKNLWGFGFKMFLSGLLDSIFSHLDSLIIGKLFQPAILGQYYRAKSLDQFVIRYTSGSLMSVLFPVLSQVNNDKQKYKQIVYSAFHVLNFVTFGLIGTLYLTGADLIVILFGDQWLKAGDYYKIIVLAGFVYPFSALLVNIISSKGNSTAFLKLEIYKKIAIGLNFAIGFWFGLEGFLYGMVIAYAIALILNIHFSAKEMEVEISWFFKIIYKYLALVFFINLILVNINLQLNINNHLTHGILYGFSFIALYIGFALLFKLEGLMITLGEIKKIISKKYENE
jgi:O-antigen/teichoic acid export membrane protein